MSFLIRLKKDDEGNVRIIEASGSEHIPDGEITVNGHVDGVNVVDLGVRVPGLSAYASSR